MRLCENDHFYFCFLACGASRKPRPSSHEALRRDRPGRDVRLCADTSGDGARIYWGNGANEDFAQPKSFLGETPFDWTVELNGDHSFKAHGALVYSIFVPPAIVFEARPPAEATNLFVQRTIFHGGSIATGADKAPERIFFDLHQATNLVHAAQ